MRAAPLTVFRELAAERVASQHGPRLAPRPRANFQGGRGFALTAGAMEGNCGTGLYNVSNTCYLNSVLQALSHVKEFRECLLSDEAGASLHAAGRAPGQSSRARPPTPTEEILSFPGFKKRRKRKKGESGDEAEETTVVPVCACPRPRSRLSGRAPLVPSPPRRPRAPRAWRPRARRVLLLSSEIEKRVSRTRRERSRAVSRTHLARARLRHHIFVFFPSFPRLTSLPRMACSASLVRSAPARDDENEQGEHRRRRPRGSRRCAPRVAPVPLLLSSPPLRSAARADARPRDATARPSSRTDRSPRASPSPPTPQANSARCSERYGPANTPRSRCVRTLRPRATPHPSRPPHLPRTAERRRAQPFSGRRSRLALRSSPGAFSPVPRLPSLPSPRISALPTAARRVDPGALLRGQPAAGCARVHPVSPRAAARGVRSGAELAAASNKPARLLPAVANTAKGVT